jgi:hypothetical protein
MLEDELPAAFLVYKNPAFCSVVAPAAVHKVLKVIDAVAVRNRSLLPVPWSP